MKKVISIVLAVTFAMVIAGCGTGDKNGDDEGDGRTTLTIKNTSDYDFTGIEYSSIDFGSINSKKEKKLEVPSNTSKPISFTLVLSHISETVLCTTDPVTCDEGKNRTITISNNTTLKDLITAPVAPVTEFTADSFSSLLVALQKIGNSAAGTYTITITNSFSLNYGIVFSVSGKKIIIQGDNVSRSIFNMSSDYSGIFTVMNGTTLELGNNIILNGNNNSDIIVSVLSGGTLIMNNGSTICGGHYRGVISNGTFIMNGGIIRDNNYKQFTSYSDGGGVIINGGTFTMNNGVISDNNTNTNGSGVNVESGTFFMNGGSIINNSAVHNGGGVNVGSVGSFIKNGGIIDDTNTAEKGKVAYVESGNKKRESTAGLSNNLDSSKTGASGGWE